MMIMSIAELEELQVNLLKNSLEEELKDLEKRQHEIITIQELNEDS